METRKLYYEDCHLRQFSATVLSCEKTENGYLVILDQTAFYPEGGGQACDTGTLGDARVTDVQEQGDGVAHFCDKPLAAGSCVTGVIDWARRFDLMQQHTGEHLLSGLIHHRFGYHNSGFHVGAQVMEVDFDGPIPPEALEELEAQANALVWADLPVNCYYPSPEALSLIAYRTKRALPWPVRIVDIPGGDTCACCGVHVAHTGEVGLIKILSCVKFHGGVRLEMVCGQRAYRYIRDVFSENRRISQMLSAKMTQTSQAVEKLQSALGEEKLRAVNLQKQVFDGIAAGYQGAENALHFEAALSGGAVRDLAERIAGVCSGVAAVVSGEDGAGYMLCLVSRSRDVRALGTQAVNALNGKGGGRSDAFQGTVRATRQQIAAFFREL